MCAFYLIQVTKNVLFSGSFSKLSSQTAKQKLDEAKAQVPIFKKAYLGFSINKNYKMAFQISYEIRLVLDLYTLVCLLCPAHLTRSMSSDRRSGHVFGKR